MAWRVETSSGSSTALYRIPTIYLMLDYVTDGGLIAYGADLRVTYRRAAEYVDTHQPAVVKSRS